jgi:hypothetical protein
MNGGVITMHPDARELQRLEKLTADQRAAILGARHALEEGRRGDALHILKAAVGTVATVSVAPQGGAVA